MPGATVDLPGGQHVHTHLDHETRIVDGARRGVGLMATPSTQPQDTVARLQRGMQAGVPVPIPGALEVRVKPPSQVAAGAATPRVDAGAGPRPAKP